MSWAAANMASHLASAAGFCAAIAACVAVQLRRQIIRKREVTAATVPTREVSGQCHCGVVTFRARVPDMLTVWVCNCSICDVLKNWHFIIPETDFCLTSGGEALTLYTFNTHTAKHTFCKHCGVTPFYRPRSNPDGVAVTLACIAPAPAPGSFVMRPFNGLDWEGFVAGSGISKFSETQAPSSPSSSPSTRASTPAPSPAPSTWHQASPSTP